MVPGVGCRSKRRKKNATLVQLIDSERTEDQPTLPLSGHPFERKPKFPGFTFHIYKMDKNQEK